VIAPSELYGPARELPEAADSPDAETALTNALDTLRREPGRSRGDHPDIVSTPGALLLAASHSRLGDGSLAAAHILDVAHRAPQLLRYDHKPAR
jgi:hypothetical protein